MRQKISGHQGARSVRKTASARSIAPSVISSTRPATQELREGEPAEVDGREVGDVEAKVGVLHRLRPVERVARVVPGTEGIRHLEHDIALEGARRERRTDVHEPEPERVGETEAKTTRLLEQQEEGVVDRQELRLQTVEPVDVEQVAPDPCGRLR